MSMRRKQSRVVEILQEYVIDGCSVRLWTDPTQLSFLPVVKTLVREGLNQESSDFAIAHALADLPGINAIQFRRFQESKSPPPAVIVYNDWP